MASIMTSQKREALISFKMFNAISAIIYLSRIVGFFPISFSKGPAGYHLVWSRKILTYSYTFTTAIVSLTVYGLSQFYQIQSVASVRLAQTSGTICTILEISWLVLTFLMGTFLTPLCFKHLWPFLNSISKVDLLLGVQIKENRCTLVTSVTLAVTLSVLVLDYSLWYGVISNHISFLEYSGNVLGLYLTYTYVMISEIYFWTLVDVIRIRLRCLNDILLKILKEKEIYEYLLGTEEYMSKELVKTVKPKRSLNDSNPNESIGEKVQRIKLAHNLLFEASTGLNNHLGIFTLVILVGCMIHLLVTPYDLYLLINDTKKYAFIGGQLVWMLGHVLRLIFIIEPCHACKRQIQQTTALICRIVSLERCQETVVQLNSLMTQVDRCPVQFSACDLIHIDRTLLTTISGTVTTYLVILFQFK